MFTPDELTKTVNSFIQLCSSHPWLSVPVVVVGISLAIAIAVKTSREHFGWVIRVLRHGTKKERLQLSAVAGVVLALAVLAPIIVIHAQQPKPYFVGIEPEVMTREFTARWQFAGDQGGSVKYHLIASGTNKTEDAWTTIPYHRVTLTGPISLRVIAKTKTGSTVSSDEVRTEIYSDSVDRLKSQGHLVVGIHADDNPGVFCYNTPDAGYQGFDIDFSKTISHYVAKKYGLAYNDPEFIFYHWPDLLEQPAKHKIDFAIASISRTKEREARYGLRFSDPYYTTSMGVVHLAGSHISDLSFADLRVMRLATNRYTTASDFADRYGLNPRRADTKQEVYALLANGEVDGILYDFARAVSEAQHRGWVVSGIRYDTLPKNRGTPAEEYSVAVASVNDSLLLAINEVIKTTGPTEIITRSIKEFQHRQTQGNDKTSAAVTR